MQRKALQKVRPMISQCQNNWVLTPTLHVGHEQDCRHSLLRRGKRNQGADLRFMAELESAEDSEKAFKRTAGKSVTTSSQGTDLTPERDSLAGRRSFEDKEQCLKAGIPRENNLTETNPLSGLAVKEGHVTRSSPYLGSCTGSGKHLRFPNGLGQFQRGA